MFQSDIDSGFCNGTARGHQVQGQAKSRICWALPSSRSPQRCHHVMASISEFHQAIESGAGQSQARFCFGEFCKTRRGNKVVPGTKSVRLDIVPGFSKQCKIRRPLLRNHQISDLRLSAAVYL
uniref:Uncharacterized protein n=1 Tax=Zea mays TaxID=4577 RepID=A0A804QZ91_MAIZE